MIFLPANNFNYFAKKLNGNSILENILLIKNDFAQLLRIYDNSRIWE